MTSNLNDLTQCSMNKERTVINNGIVADTRLVLDSVGKSNAVALSAIARSFHGVQSKMQQNMYIKHLQNFLYA
jgi:hypothetical protein